MAETKTAFITGITGQDGALLAELLVGKGYSVHGLVRWDSYADPLDGLSRLDELGLVNDAVSLHMGDMNDAHNLSSLIKKVKPDEIYNLAALSHVKVSFETPASAFDTNAKGVLHLLEALRVLGMEKSVRVYQASSSEMFGNAPAPQNEDTPMNPCSPYGAAKLAAYHLARIYRASYGMFIANGILFNHESGLRGEGFVTRKITRAVAAIEAGAQQVLTLGNLGSLRDWGHARDYVRGMWAMLQQKEAGDYVLASGQAHSVREFVERAFVHTGVKIEWQGEGAEETGVDAKTGRVLVTVDPALFRPTELDYLQGDAAKARRELGWQLEYSFESLIAEMVNEDRTKLRSKAGERGWQVAG